MSKRIIDYCIDIATKNSNDPLHVKEIYTKMRRRRWQTKGKTPKQTITKTLNKDYRFNRVAPNTFKLDDTFYNNRINK